MLPPRRRRPRPVAFLSRCYRCATSLRCHGHRGLGTDGIDIISFKLRAPFASKYAHAARGGGLQTGYHTHWLSNPREFYACPAAVR